MKNKKFVIVIILIIVIAILWLCGIIPKQIAKISAVYQLNKQFPEWELKLVNVEV